MKPCLKKHLLLLLTASTLTIVLSGCGDANTTITEKASIPSEDEHDHTGEPGGTAVGRLLIINTEDTEAEVYDLNDGSLLTAIPLDAQPSAVYATGGYRYAALVERTADKVGFIDAGLWQEAHDDHFDLFTTMPMLSKVSLTGSRPTHFLSHEGQVAVFLDGDMETGANAGVQVFDDHIIEEAAMPLTVEFTMPQHGAAEPRGEHLLASIRRDDAESTSSNFILPDQVGVFHLHDDAYELEQVFDVACPDLHGAEQNETHVVFGCSDGVLLITDNGDDTYSAQKLLIPDDVEDGLRIGSLWGHHNSGQFIGQGSAPTSDTVHFFAIDPTEARVELIDWHAMADARPVARDFAFEAEQFIILDDQGYLTVLEPHLDGDHTHWEYGTRLDITDADVSTMPEGANFSMTFAQNAHTAYIADPIEKHVLTVDLELMQGIGELELDYAPAMITWLGIAEVHDH